MTVKLKKTYDSICDEAKELTGGARMKSYGHPRDNFTNIARLWNAYLENKNDKKVNINNKDVAFMMALVKIAREQTGHTRDNLVDAIGYIRTKAQIEGIE